SCPATRSAGSTESSGETAEAHEASADHRLRGLAALRVAGDGGEELVTLQRVQEHVRARGDGRRPRNVAQERDLSEVVASLERGESLLLGVDVDDALRED